jgi:hypothetical protein
MSKPMSKKQELKPHNLGWHVHVLRTSVPGINQYKLYYGTPDSYICHITEEQYHDFRKLLFDADTRPQPAPGTAVSDAEDLIFNIMSGAIVIDADRNVVCKAIQDVIARVGELEKERDVFIKDAGYALDCYTAAVMTRTTVQKGVAEMAAEIIGQAIELRKET